MVGSYLNVLIHRIPLGKSTVFPRSACPWCDGIVRARDNIPVLSFLLLRAKCRHCGAPIAWRYPVVELLTAALLALCMARYGPTVSFVTMGLFATLMILLAGIDCDHFLLPDKITLPGIVVGLALSPWNPHTSLPGAAIGTVTGAGLLILVINFWYWIRGEEGMGLGDVNMLALIGAFLGWQGVLSTLFLALLLGTLIGLPLLGLGRVGMRSRLPFGIFLALGGLATLFFGDHLIDLYSGLL